MLGIDLNEIASNSVVGFALAVCSWIGARIGGVISKINRAEKDLNALWPRFRELEAIIKGGKDGAASGHRDQAGNALPDPGSGRQSGDQRSVGDREKDEANV